MFMINLNSEIYCPFGQKKWANMKAKEKLGEATTMRRKCSDGGKMAAPTKEIKEANTNKKLKNDEEKTTNLLRHLNEISFVIPFSFLMMEILKFLALSPTWISNCAIVLEGKGAFVRFCFGCSARQSTRSQTIKIINFTSDLCTRKAAARGDT